MLQAFNKFLQLVFFREGFFFCFQLPYGTLFLVKFYGVNKLAAMRAVRFVAGSPFSAIPAFDFTTAQWP
jgi:hypothetical protein